jgi:hypothetical protein
LRGDSEIFSGGRGRLKNGGYSFIESWIAWLHRSGTWPAGFVEEKISDKPLFFVPEDCGFPSPPRDAQTARQYDAATFEYISLIFTLSQNMIFQRASKSDFT